MASPKTQSTTKTRSKSVTSERSVAGRAASAEATPPVAPTVSSASAMPATSPAPSASSIFEGLPSPEELAKYEKIVPGGAERLIELAEQRAAHREATERRALESEIKSGQVRTIIGFVLALSIGILGGMLLLQGSELAGLILILIDAAALVGVTLYGRREA